MYLYLMNYAKTQPELVILAVNTFVKVNLYRQSLRFTTRLQRSYRTPPIKTRSFERSQSGPCLRCARRKSSLTSVIRYPDVSATKIPTCGRLRHSAWQRSTSSSPNFAWTTVS